jgi:hypothetical protein
MASLPHGAPLHAAGPGGLLEEALPLNAEEAAVYLAMARVCPPGYMDRCDGELIIKCIRGYKKERARVEVTATELQRIVEWRETHELDLVRAMCWRARLTRVCAFGCGA